MWIFDTDVLIWLLKGNSKAYTLISQTDTPIISAISYMELVQGVRNKRGFLELRRLLSEWAFKIL